MDMVIVAAMVTALEQRIVEKRVVAVVAGARHAGEFSEGRQGDFASKVWAGGASGLKYNLFTSCSWCSLFLVFTAKFKSSCAFPVLLF